MNTGRMLTRTLVVVVLVGLLVGVAFCTCAPRLIVERILGAEDRTTQARFDPALLGDTDTTVLVLEFDESVRVTNT